MLARTTSAISKRITQFQVEAAQLRGPKGNTGRIGQGLIAGAGARPDVRPDGHEWAPGDSWLDTKSEGFQLSYMAADGSWSAPVRLVPAPKLINAVQNVLDQSTRVQGTTIVNNSTSTGGGGVARPLVAAIPTGGNTLVFESLDQARRNLVSRAFTCQLILIVTSGALTGQSVTLLITGLLHGTANTVTCEYSEIESSGGLAGQCTPAITAQLGNASDPAVRTQVLQVFVGGLSGPFDGAAIQGWCIFTEDK